MDRYDEMLAAPECPYAFSLRSKAGDEYPGRPPYPMIVVLRSSDVHVREVRLHSLRVRAIKPETGVQQEVEVVRLVAVLEGGEEMEVSRTAIPAELADGQPVDPAKCAACGLPIPPGGGIVDGGHMYHRGTCLRE